jgi:hypothetical protein
MNHFTTQIIVISLLAVTGCTDFQASPPTTAAGTASLSGTESDTAVANPKIQLAGTSSVEEPKPTKLLHLKAYFAAEPSLGGEVSFKVTGAEGDVAKGKEFDVDIEGGTPGDVFAVLLNGEDLGEIRIDLSGEGEMELDQYSLPEGFRDPEPGATVKLGDRIEVELATLETLTHLESRFEGANGTVGEISYKIEDLAGQVCKEFQLEVEDGEPGREFEVTVDGVKIGTITLDDEGEGDLRIGRGEVEFPKEFRNPKPGSVVKVGQQFTARLDDVQ